MCRETSFRLGLPLRLYSFIEASNNPAHAPYNTAAECNPITCREGAEGGGGGKISPADALGLTEDAGDGERQVPGAAEKYLFRLLGGICLNPKKGEKSGCGNRALLKSRTPPGSLL